MGIWYVGMDLMEKFLKSKSEFNYLGLEVDYFSKWIKVQPLVNPIEENVLNFFHNSILCRFRVPRAIVNNHGTKFSKIFTLELVLQALKKNGQAEATNKLVLQALKKNLEGTLRKWVDELYFAVWSVRTLAWETTGKIPFALVYGSQVVGLAELALSTHRIITYDITENDQNRLCYLDILD